MSENNSYSYEWPFLKEEDGFRTWMLGQKGRDFSVPLPFVESECGVIWREDKVHWVPSKVGSNCGTARIYGECVMRTCACCEMSLHTPDRNESEQVRW